MSDELLADPWRYVAVKLPAISGRKLSEIADLRCSKRTRTHQSTVSVVVKRLVERGLVKRTPSAHDARCVELAATKRGLALLARAPLAAQDELIAGVERLTPAQRSALASSLHALVVAMQLDAEPPAMFFEEDARKAPGQGVRNVAP